MWACQSRWLTALKWPTEKQLVFFFFFAFAFPLIFLCIFSPSDVASVMPGPYQETQFVRARGGCHSLWLTALRFPGGGGISFKLLGSTLSLDYFIIHGSAFTLNTQRLTRQTSPCSHSSSFSFFFCAALCPSDLGSHFDRQMAIHIR